MNPDKATRVCNPGSIIQVTTNEIKSIFLIAFLIQKMNLSSGRLPIFMEATIPDFYMEKELQIASLTKENLIELRSWAFSLFSLIMQIEK